MVEIDGHLVARLEATAAQLGASVAGRMVAAGVPGASPAEAFCGGALIVLGPGRYLNRAVGIGAAAVSAEEADQLEAYFRGHGSHPAIEVSSWASPSLIEVVAGRAYRPAWFRNIYARLLVPATDGGGTEVVIRQVDDELVGPWLDVLADGNGLSNPSDRSISDEYATARYAMPEGTNFLAFVDGRPAGCGSLEIAAGVGWVGGAATIEAFRGRGVQTALLRHRLQLAAAHGCDIAAASSLPTGTSARNLGRSGFSLAFTHVVMTRP